MTSLNPTSGPTTGANAVTITGANFTGATAVDFGTTPATFTVTNATTIAATAPAGAGTIDVTVTTGSGTSNVTVNDQYTYIAPPPPPAPTVTSLSPTSGPSTGATPVTITGTNFTGATAVDFGTTPATFTITNATTINTTAPVGTGTVDVTVTTGNGTSTTSAGDQYTYLSPPPGTIPSPDAGGWQLNGTAQLVASPAPANLQLTPATNWVSGSAFYPTPVPGAGITASFDAYIGPGSGADGMTFTLADASVTPPTTIGDNGGGEGFAGINGIAVSLDTWQNSSDPSSNFVGIATATAPVQSLTYAATNTTIPSLIDTVHHYVVTTSTTGLVVTMDGTQVLNYATTLPPYVLVGFTAATGGFNNIHQVQNVSITAGSPPPAATVTSVSPNSGPNTAGTTVAISGTNFYGVGAVNFGASPATFTINSPTSITATAPAGTSTVDVTVANGSGTSATNANDQYTYVTGPPPPPPAPTVTSLNPATGPTTGANAVTITGANFTGATAVDFGTTPATFTVTNATTIAATAPAGAGTIDVTVTTGSGTSNVTVNDQYTYIAPPPPPAPTVTSLSPTSGPSTGATPVTITGTNFTGATAVDFGTTPATFTVTNATTIAATAPAGAGTIDVTVTTGSGTSNVTVNDQYTYIAPPPPPAPTVTSLSPTSGPSTGATPVTITGTNFTGATAVDFGTTPATFTIANATTINTTAPVGTGTVDVTVTTGNGTSTTSAGDQYTYLSPPPGTIPSPDAGGWQLNGTAQLVASPAPANLQLTPATNWVSGSAFYPTPVPGAGITASFDAYIGPGSGADGMTFTLADASVTPPTTIGDNGGGEGFAGINGIAVSLDTWQNSSDPSSNFVGIATATAPVQSLTYAATNTTIPSLIDTVHHYVVTTSTTGLVVTMDGTQVLNYATTLPPYVLVGFTAATGGFNNIHQVQNVSITAGSPPPAPTVTSVSPNSGPNTAGTTVAISGTNFYGVGAVNFGASPATFTINSPTSITATAPAGTSTVDVTVANGAGTSATNANDQYTYVTGPPPPPPAPTVTGLNPATGPTSGGTDVTITGTNFTGTSSVNFGANPATFVVTNDGSIDATAPTALTGVVDVTVTNGGGTQRHEPGRPVHLRRRTAAAADHHERRPGERAGRQPGHAGRHQLHHGDGGAFRIRGGDVHRQQRRHPHRHRPRRDGDGGRHRHQRCRHE